MVSLQSAVWVAAAAARDESVEDADDDNDRDRCEGYDDTTEVVVVKMDDRDDSDGTVSDPTEGTDDTVDADVDTTDDGSEDKKGDVDEVTPTTILSQSPPTLDLGIVYALTAQSADRSEEGW